MQHLVNTEFAQFTVVYIVHLDICVKIFFLLNDVASKFLLNIHINRLNLIKLQSNHAAQLFNLSTSPWAVKVHTDFVKSQQIHINIISYQTHHPSLFIKF